MKFPKDFVNQVVCADALEGLRQIPDGVIQCCVTSPPYWGLRDYGISGQIGLESTPEEYVAKMVEVFREVRRILRDDGTLWLNLGDSYAGSCRGADTKYGNKKLEEDSLKVKPDWSISGLKPKDLVMIPARVALALQADGWWLRSVIIWNKPSCMPESVTDRPTTSHEYVYLLAKSADYYYDQNAIRERPKSGGIGLLTFHKNTEAGRMRNDSGGFYIMDGSVGANKRTVWTISTETTPYAHFATFPQKLVEPCIMAGTSEKGNCGKCGKPWVRVVELDAEYGKHASMRKVNVDPIAFGRALRKVRSISELSVSDLSEHFLSKSGGKTGLVSNWELGKMLPIPEHYRRLKKLLPDLPSHFDVLGEELSGMKQGGWIDDDIDTLIEGHRKSGKSLTKKVKTTGWQPSCSCGADPVPPIVIDPFSGSSTVGVVAKKLQRNYIMIDLSAEYNEKIAKPRLSQGEMQLK